MNNAYKANGGRGYGHVIFDADDTLLRYRDDERGAFSRLFLRHGITPDEELLSFSNAASEEVWTKTGLYDVHSPAIQRRYHELYRAHVEHVFEKILSFLAARGVYVAGDKKADISGTGAAIPHGLADSSETGAAVSGILAVSAAKLRDEFLKELETGGNLVDGAAETLSALKARGYIISIATNGLTAIQIGRTKPLGGLFDNLFVSEAIGVIKPTTAFFERLLAGLGAKKEDCLFVGDSLASDVAGANGAGIDCCLFDPRGKYAAGGVSGGVFGGAGTAKAKPDYVIRKLTELLDLL